MEKKILKLIATLMLCLLASFETASKDYQTLSWGYVEFAPYHYEFEGKVAGIIAERVDKLMTQLKINYRTVQLPNKRAQQFIDEGKVDFTTVIESFLLSPQKFLKSNFPVYAIKLGALCTQNDLNIRNIEDLKSLPLILLSGYSYGQKKRLTNSDYKIMLAVGNHSRAIKAVNLGRGKCALGYQLPFEAASKAHQKNNLHFYEISEFPVYLYLNKNVPNAEHIMGLVNAQIAGT